MLRIFCLALTFLLSALLRPSASLADDWTACMAQPAPKFFYVADKSRKLLFQMEEKSGATSAAREFECIHGRVEGDKQKQGDLKTPEGVYFITKVITQKLDYMEYGPYAVALNYPNPADRLRKKTGSGIWLHSKGRKITGITTRGCLAIDKGEIMEIAPLLKPGTPVIVAEKVAGDPFYGRDGQALPSGLPAPEAVPAPPVLPKGSTEVSGRLTQEGKAGSSTASACVHAVDFPVAPTPAFAAVQTADASIIRDLAKLWMALRLQKTEEIFNLYDGKAWPAASREKFSLKKTRLRTEFKERKGFRIGDDLSILHGPGYWVSCFTESYALKDGGRRSDLRALYWMKDASGRYRIIGEARIRK
ncbi:MAG: L,D-transpeptidase family protein [Mailhella sp.]|nr:L,D-transpeptidase family protein [Mailhella sp.]